MSRRTRVGLASAALVLLLLLAAWARLSLGARIASPAQLLEVFSGGGRGALRFMVLQDRLPAVVAAVLAGAALALSGGLFQRLLRNPLASPDIIGVGYGASAATVIGMLVLGLGGWALSGLALLGALAVAGAILAMSLGKGDMGARLVLSGLAIGAALAAVVNLLLTRTDVRSAADALRWIAGSVTDATWEKLGVLALSLLVLALLTALVAPRLALLELGDDAARALGVRVTAARIALVALGAALCAAAVAVVGPLSFVAFMCHPLATRLLGSRGNLAVTALTGSTLVVVSDLLAAHLFGIGNGLPVGVVTGALGAVFLLLVLSKERS
ncbi:iron ABC transporter permease [Galactobacter valiniphilus]|uniref:Iron ABC transporter permease n=1 Tax=Galactobacter valiniphilus TaxID=2676122 RepID=A0A399JHA4_9MICC|nr:iron chelate uptake ABC transporter family permease subunit [Galactobacter valiniphilus]RII43562.1 iron ABC transporter permease [Galactobacter valiniphilus]